METLPSVDTRLGHREQATRIGIPWIEAQGLVRLRDGLVEPACSRQGGSQVLVSGIGVGLQPGRLFEVRNGVLEPAGLRERQCEAGVSGGEVRLKAQCFGELRNRFGYPALARQHQAHVVVEDRDARPQPECFRAVTEPDGTLAP